MTEKYIIGWHGTTEHRADKIMKENFDLTRYTKSGKKDTLPPDLGTGSYFFIEDEILTYDIQRHIEKFLLRFRDKYGDRKCILEVKIKNDKMLDLDKKNNLERFY